MDTMSTRVLYSLNEKNVKIVQICIHYINTYTKYQYNKIKYKVVAFDGYMKIKVK